MDELVYLIMEIVSLIVDSVDVLIKYVKFCICVGREYDVEVDLFSYMLLGMDWLRKSSLMKLGNCS